MRVVPVKQDLHCVLKPEHDADSFWGVPGEVPTSVPPARIDASASSILILGVTGSVADGIELKDRKRRSLPLIGRISRCPLTAFGLVRDCLLASNIAYFTGCEGEKVRALKSKALVRNGLDQRR